MCADSRWRKYTVGPTQSFKGPTLINNSKANTVIIAGTIGKSDVISQLINTKKLDVSAIEGQWESFISEVISNPLPGVDKALVIAGADLRGTVFGLYDVSEQIGVSPWWWFADVAVKKASGIWALAEKKVQASPSVKYRGIFINDEQPALSNWIKYVSILGGNIVNKELTSTQCELSAWEIRSWLQPLLLFECL